MLDRQTYLVKERVGLMKLTDTFDIFDATNGLQVGMAQERLGIGTKLLRLLMHKRTLPTRIEIKEREEAAALLVLRRGFTFLRARIEVLDAAGQRLGWFRSKLLSLGGGFFVVDAQERPVAEVKGDWKGWNFKMVAQDGRELGTVSKKWAGAAKELFTSADNYVIHLTEPGNAGTAGLLLAAGLAIDIVFKEK